MKTIMLLFIILTLCSACEELEELLGKDKEPTKNSCDQPYPPVTSPLPKLNAHLSKFNSCQDVEIFLADKIQTRKFEESKMSDYWNQCPIPISEPASGNSGDSQQPTNTQEVGIDESDIVKRSKDYIFAVKPGFLEVLHIDDLSIVQSIKVNDINQSKIFLHNNLLILFGQNAQLSLAQNPYYNQYQTVKVFKVKDQLTLLKTFNIKGRIISSRLKKNGHLTFVTSSHLNTYYQDPNNSIATQLKDISCEHMYKPVVSDNSTNLTLIHSIDLTNSKNISYSQSSLIGGHNQLYMGKKGLYLTKPYIDWFYWDQRPNSAKGNSHIVKFEAQGKSWKATSFGSFKGHALNQWSFKEYGKKLAVATTSGGFNWGIIGPNQNSEPRSNNLYILSQTNESLKNTASVEGFGLDETIRSVRYIKDKAYVVTFRETDPLFLINLENLSQPVILDELKAPGFSKYMHPVSEDTLLGFGIFDQWSGLQLSLFDMSNPYNLGILEQIKVGNSSSFSDALYDHTAFYFSKNYNYVGFPIIHYNYDQDSSKHNSSSFTGAEIYKINDGSFSLQAQLTHRPWMMQQCQINPDNPYFYYSYNRSLDINRVFEIDGRLFTLSRFGIKEHKVDDPTKTLQFQKFPSSKNDCNTLTMYQ